MFCPDCRGTGVYTPPADTGSSTMDVSVTCPTCAGRGRMSADDKLPLEGFGTSGPVDGDPGARFETGSGGVSGGGGAGYFEQASVPAPVDTGRWVRDETSTGTWSRWRIPGCDNHLRVFPTGVCDGELGAATAADLRAAADLIDAHTEGTT